MTASSTAFFSHINVRRNDQQSNLDIYGLTREATGQFYEDLNAFASQLEDGSEVTLSDGTKVDTQSVAGMTVFQVHMNFQQANLELVNNVFTFIRNFEQKLDNMLSG